MSKQNDQLIYAQESYNIRGAIFEVYRDKGSGFLESVYQECLEREFLHLGIPYEAQKEITISYRGKELFQRFKADFVCYGKIILEIKAVTSIIRDHKAQLRNYLRATGMHLGLVVNFGEFPNVGLFTVTPNWNG